MGKQCDTILFGSGIDGLTAASILSRMNGKRVLVLEPHYIIAGQTHEFRAFSLERKQTMATLVDRMKGAALLDIDVYEEVEADENLTGQAALVVVLAAIAQALALIVGRVAGLSVMIALPLYSILGWVLWAVVTYYIGTKVFGGTATIGEMLRTIGFCHSPGVLYILSGLPFLGTIIGFAVGLWMLICGVIAIRQALDIDTAKAVLTALIGWLVLMIPTWILYSILMPGVSI